jgi:hypothetical protein
LIQIDLIEVKNSSEKSELELEELIHENISENENFEFVHDLMNDREYCDIKFIVQDLEFNVHSRLLKSKSSKFMPMFAEN